jgi:hypothetical protein
MTLMNKALTTLTIASLGTILFSISSRAGSLAFDAAGNLFKGEFPEIVKFTPDGKRSPFAGLSQPPKRMYSPYLAFDDKGNLLVSVCDTISKFTPDGKKSTFAAGIKYSADLAFDGKGNLFVLDSSGSIFKFTPDGKRSTFASGLHSPQGLAFDDKGNLAVFEGENSILKFTPEGVKSIFATGVESPSDIAFDHSGNLFVSKVSSSSIFKYTPGGNKSIFATAKDVDDMAFDAAGNLFVSQIGDLIFKFAPDGTRSTFASARISPDTQWEYKYSADGDSPRVAKAGTSETVLDLSKDVPSQWAKEARIIWSPDSKRFALNYKADDSSTLTALYQLRGEKWVALRSPITKQTTELVERAPTAELRKAHLPRNVQPYRDFITWELTQWTDSNTANLYAYSSWSAGDISDLAEHFLFTLKFDAKGNWKIVKTHKMADAEIDELH